MEKLTFNQLVFIYYGLVIILICWLGIMYLKSLYWSRSQKRALTFDDFKAVYEQSPSGSELQTLALQKMSEFVKP